MNPVKQVGQVFERGVLAAVGLSHKRSTKRTRVTYGESRHSDRARLIGRVIRTRLTECDRELIIG